MYLSAGWEEYSLLDAGNGEKLERWGKYTLLRPEPQALWPMAETPASDCRYIRSSDGGGHWEFYKKLPEAWRIHYENLVFIVRPTGFKHTGLFPEQAVNWGFMQNLVKKRSACRVLNLFAYTGGATCALAASGGHVTHVDAAKGIVAWAKENYLASGLNQNNVRFLVDDAMKFILREGRRGSRYDAILMDPPSYGRGPKGELWKIEQSLYPLVEAAAGLLSDNPLFFLVNSYTTGFAPSALKNVLQAALFEKHPHIEADEVGLPILNRGMCLPLGATARAVWS
ncbi:MAG: Ribosomal RNA large subunit methyltransferase K [Firmicutes bacterium ADurb.Bin356]|nr:MAG: Ribosomal RNA large subunit methyltransferase K [Firmicutes bacterium ADurb.Bin356]